MKEKIIQETTNPATGYSSFYFQNKYGQFWGWAFRCAQDEYSRFVGLRYAEIRARKAFAKKRLAQEKIKLQTIQALKKDICDNIPEDKQNKKIMRRINLKLRDYSQSVSDWNNLYNYLCTAIQEQEKTRQEILLRSKKDK